MDRSPEPTPFSLQDCLHAYHPPEPPPSFVEDVIASRLTKENQAPGTHPHQKPATIGWFSFLLARFDLVAVGVCMCALMIGGFVSHTELAPSVNSRASQQTTSHPLRQSASISAVRARIASPQMEESAAFLSSATFPFRSSLHVVPHYEEPTHKMSSPSVATFLKQMELYK
jgi:hypothetical protein